MPCKSWSIAARRPDRPPACRLRSAGARDNHGGRHGAEAGSASCAERASLLADARAALTWACYANDGGADLRVPLAGACARLSVELNLLNEGRPLVQSGARGPR